VDIKNLAELKEKFPQIYEMVMEQASKDLAEEYDTVITKTVSENETKIREEVRAELQKDLEKPVAEQLASKDKEIADLTKLNEELETQFEELTAQVEQLKTESAAAVTEATKKLTERVEAVETKSAKDAARAHVLTKIANHPHRTVLEAMILGPAEDASKELKEEYKDTTPPKDIAEADARLAAVVRMAKSLGVSTEKGRGPDGESLTEGTSRPNRLQTLAGV
jgi:seryl-tRNA synthetase